VSSSSSRINTVKRAASAPSITRWSYDNDKGSIRRGLNSCPSQTGVIRARATPKIANYPFTTLNPMVGVVEFPKFRRCTVADIPGLIEGAHDNRGLGHEFLRHITRCRLLLFVIDMAGSEMRDPIEDLQILRKEIKLYDPEVANFDWLIIANKMDLEGAEENLKTFKARFPKQTIIPLSAETEEGIEALREELDKRVGYRRDGV